MEPKMQWISQWIEQSLTLEYQAGGVTPVVPPHDTGWRTLSGTLTASIHAYESVLFRVGLPDLTIRAGQTICVPQGQHHRIMLVGKRKGISRWSQIAYRLGGGIDIFKLYQPPAVFTGDNSKKIGQINEQLSVVSLPCAIPPTDLIKRKALTLELLAILLASSTVLDHHILPNTTMIERIEKARELMAKDPTQPPSISQMARACSLSISRFHATFKLLMGVAPGRYLQDMKLQRAKHLLFNSNLSVKAISSAAGFGDEFHFSRIFRKRCGLSPSAFRDQARNNRYF
jgi:AraC-like DNA-binding protein